MVWKKILIAAAVFFVVLITAIYVFVTFYDFNKLKPMIAQAIKASGTIVSVEVSDFISILSRSDSPLVVAAEGGFLKTNYQYLTSYKGLFFYTESSEALQLPSKAETVTAEKIWMP